VKGVLWKNLGVGRNQLRERERECGKCAEYQKEGIA